MNNPRQSNKTRDKSAREDGFPSQKVEWTNELLKEVYEKWYLKYKDVAHPCNFYMFSEYFKGEKEDFSLFFNEYHSDSNLIRVGCLLGLSRNQQDNVFKNYRRRYNKTRNLNSSSLPKNFFAKEKGWEFYDDLLKLLEENDIFYINPFLSQEERKATIEKRKKKYQSEINSLEYQISISKKEIEYREKKITVLSKMETSVI